MGESKRASCSVSLGPDCYNHESSPCLVFQYLYILVKSQVKPFERKYQLCTVVQIKFTYKTAGIAVGHLILVSIRKYLNGLSSQSGMFAFFWCGFVWNEEAGDRAKLTLCCPLIFPFEQRDMSLYYSLKSLNTNGSKIIGTDDEARPICPISTFVSSSPDQQVAPVLGQCLQLFDYKGSFFC